MPRRSILGVSVSWPSRCWDLPLHRPLPQVLSNMSPPTDTVQVCKVHCSLPTLVAALRDCTLAFAFCAIVVGAAVPWSALRLVPAFTAISSLFNTAAAHFDGRFTSEGVADVLAKLGCEVFSLCFVAVAVLCSAYRAMADVQDCRRHNTLSSKKRQPLWN